MRERTVSITTCHVVHHLDVDSGVYNVAAKPFSRVSMVLCVAVQTTFLLGAASCFPARTTLPSFALLQLSRRVTSLRRCQAASRGAQWCRLTMRWHCDDQPNVPVLSPMENMTVAAFNKQAPTRHCTRIDVQRSLMADLDKPGWLFVSDNSLFLMAQVPQCRLLPNSGPASMPAHQPRRTAHPRGTALTGWERSRHRQFRALAKTQHHLRRTRPFPAAKSQVWLYL